MREAAGRYGVSNLRVFGSVARGTETSDSDVDLLADLPADVGLFALARLRRELESIVGAPVDIIPAHDLKSGVRPDVERDALAL